MYSSMYTHYIRLRLISVMVKKNLQKRNFNIPKNTVQYKVVVHHPGDNVVTLTVSSWEQLSNRDSNTTFVAAKCLRYFMFC